MSVTDIAEVIRAVQEKKMKWSNTLYLQLDGGSENKNRYSCYMPPPTHSWGGVQENKTGISLCWPYPRGHRSVIQCAGGVVSRDHSAICLIRQAARARPLN